MVNILAGWGRAVESGKDALEFLRSTATLAAFTQSQSLCRAVLPALQNFRFCPCRVAWARIEITGYFPSYN